VVADTQPKQVRGAVTVTQEAGPTVAVWGGR
jgi:hypothetical protein